jgi:NAD-dependent deacetylase
MVPVDVINGLLSVQRMVVLSGSGMSAESGIPTFRDALTGLWSRYRPEELATPEAFARDPARVWSWYESRRCRVAAARPHAGHAALVRLEALVGELAVVTQNVDGLHQRAGSTQVLELHGNILRTICSRSHRVIDADWISRSVDVPPKSPFVEDGLARPDVVWFGEPLPRGVLEAAIDLIERCDACLAVGTSALVEPAASLPLIAKRQGALLIEINPRETPLSRYADHCLRDNAGPALCELAERLEGAVSA